jgi:hypothetical protein
MAENKFDQKPTLSKEELQALLEPQILSLSNLQEALGGKTRLFKVCLTALTILTLSYLMVYSSGLLDRFVSHGWTQHYEDYRIHQIRFGLGFLMLVLFYIWVLLKKPLGTILACCTGVLCYFLVSGTARLFVVLDPAKDTWFITVYFLLQLSFIALLLVMIREERRSSW